MTLPRVGFDTAALDPPHSRGVARAARETLAALEALGELEVVRLAPPAGSDLRRWRRRGLPAAARAARVLGVHSFTSAFPLTGPGRRVQTIHELPWRHGVREDSDWRHRFWAAVGPLRADRVVVPSEHVARDLRRRRLPGAGRVRVVPWGVGPPFGPEPPEDAIDELVLDRYRLGDEPFALALGCVRPKKDLAASLRGLAALRALGRPLPRLVVTGPDTPALRRDLGLASRLGLARWIVTLEEVEERDLPALLRLAAFVTVLSRSEGFGLPVLEALASGTPAVVAAGSAQGETAGSAGIPVDPSDAESVARGFARALDERRGRAAAGLERAAGLTWEASAGRLAAVWKELL